MDKHKLDVILQKHQAWLNNTEGGERADLSYAYLSHADLRGADLHAADLYGANLRAADLSYANLREANLFGADLHGADLRAVNLHGADLRAVNLHRADLYAVNLHGADLDFASWPLHCGSLSPGKCDRRLTAQLVRHTLAVALAEGDVYGAAVIEALAPLDCFHEFRTDIKPFNKGRVAC